MTLGEEGGQAIGSNPRCHIHSVEQNAEKNHGSGRWTVFVRRGLKPEVT